uniref:DNA helicase n=1 Tax=Aureoumbra lagunensis TaxID=44058 RepID=A0A7S3JVH1_9STRA
MSVAVRIQSEMLPEGGGFGVGLRNGLIEIRMTSLGRICNPSLESPQQRGKNYKQEEDELCVAGIVDKLLDWSKTGDNRVWLQLRLIAGSERECITLTLWDTAALSCRCVRPGLAVIATKCRRTGQTDHLYAYKIAGCVSDDVVVAVETATLQSMHPDWEFLKAQRLVENKLKALRLRREKFNEWQHDALGIIRRDHCWCCGCSWNGVNCSSFPLCGGRKSAAFSVQNVAVPAIAFELVWNEVTEEINILRLRPLPAPRGEPSIQNLSSSLVDFRLEDYKSVLATQRQLVSKNCFRGLREPPECIISTLRREPLRERSAQEIESLFQTLPESLQTFLKPFQRDGVKFCLRKRKAYLADDMGLGKTVQAIATALALKKEWPLLIICPAGVRTMWVDQIERFVPQLAPNEIKLVTCSNDAPDPPPAKSPSIVIISFRMLERLRQLQADAGLFEFSTVIVDEAQLLTSSVNPNEAKQTAIACAWIRKAPNVILLSGTPAMVRPISMFSCLDALLPSSWLRSLEISDRKLEFLRYWCGARVSRFGHYSKGYASFDAINFHDELNAILRALCMLRRLKKNVLTQLPKLVRKVIRLEINSTTQEDQTKTNFMASGLAKVDSACKWIIQFLEETSQLETKLVVFGHHIAVLNSICAALEASRNKNWQGLTPGRIDGSVNAEMRASLTRHFRNEGQARVLVVSVTAGGVGIDLSAASHAVFIESVGLQAAWIRQAEDRLHRQGQRNSVCVYYLLGTSADHKGWPSLYAALLSNTTVFNGAKEAERFLVDQVLEDKEDIGFNLAAPSEAIQSVPLDAALNQEVMVEKNDDDLEAWRWTVDEDSSDEHENNLGGENDGLLFEVSENSGRVHLHEAGKRLGQTAEAAELELPRIVARGATISTTQGWRIGARRARSVARTSLPPRLAQDGRLARLAWIFRRQWNALMTIQQADLYGVPIRPPLALAVAHQNAQNASSQAVASTRRRYMPCLEAALDGCRGYVDFPGCEIINVRVVGREYLGLPPIPRIINRKAHTAKCLCCSEFFKVAVDAFFETNTSTLQGEIKRSITAANMSSLFCSQKCRDKYKATTSASGLRELVFARDHGICQNCGVDCHALVQQLKALRSASYGSKVTIVLESNPKWKDYRELMKKLITKPRDGLAWEADHIYRVADGGGEATVEQLQTLCVPCHKNKTRSENTKDRIQSTKRAVKHSKKRPLESSSTANNNLRHCEEFPGHKPRPNVVLDGTDEDDELFGPNAPKPIIKKKVRQESLSPFKCSQLPSDDDGVTGIPDLDL